MKHFAAVLILTSLFASASPAHAQEPSSADRLRCESQDTPLAIETNTPRLSWILQSKERNATQTAFQILVASTPEKLANDDGDLWNPGKVDSNSLSVTYQGTPLPSGIPAYWKVRLSDANGKVSAWSKPASWSAGLGKAEDWKAQWIAGSEAPLPLFRKTFSPGKPIRRAMVYICGLGQFELSLNGEKVGNHVLDPGWTNYKKSCLYVPFDITEKIRSGENALGVMLGNGLYNVKGGRYVKFLGSFGEPKVILQLHIDYTDGTNDTVMTDTSWKTTPGPITFSCMYGGEDYDAQREMPGWDAPGFDDSTWTPVRPVAGPGGVLRAQEQPPIVVVEKTKPLSVTKLAEGKYEVDLGLNLSARPAIRVQGKAGTKVTIETAERKGTLWPGHSYTYTLKGQGQETFTPRFTYFGFQYLYITGADWGNDAKAETGRPVLLDAGADFITSASTPVGTFDCDNPLFNEIDAMITRSVRSNLQSVLTDCPHREKLGWLEVSHLMGPSILYHFDAQQLYAKIARDTTEAQLDNGMVPDIAPEYTRFNGGFFESPEWGSASVQIPWLLYRWYGDESILSRQFDTMASYTRYLASTRDEKGLAKGGLGDWYDWTPEKGHVGDSQLTPDELTATCMLFDNARILAKTATLLHRDPKDIEYFTGLSEMVRKHFIKAYYDPEKKTVARGSQAALAAALYFDLVPQEDRGAVLARLVGELESNGYKQSTGEVCFRYLVQALTQAGRSDVVYRMIDRTDAPGYGCMLKQFGLKTLSECWDKPGSSLNHCMFGHIQEWFQDGLLGIQQEPDSNGFSKLRIAPLFIAGLSKAQGAFDSPRGRIEVRWKRNAQGLNLTTTIPGNTTADIVLPGKQGALVTESGKPAQGVQYLEDGIHCPVGAGTYNFQVSTSPNNK